MGGGGGGVGIKKITQRQQQQQQRIQRGKHVPTDGSLSLTNYSVCRVRFSYKCQETDKGPLINLNQKILLFNKTKQNKKEKEKNLSLPAWTDHARAQVALITVFNSLASLWGSRDFLFCSRVCVCVCVRLGCVENANILPLLLIVSSPIATLLPPARGERNFDVVSHYLPL